MSSKQIGDKIGISHSSVLYWLKKKRIKRRSRSEALKAVIANGGMRLPRASGDRHYNWNGGKTRLKGYDAIMLKDHPRCPAHGYMPVHVIVAEKAIGRLLLHNEVAHHINGDKLDNRPENIAVITRAEHVIHHKPRLCKK
jgi:hypothetical protein